MLQKTKRRPTHPGTILREDTLPELNLASEALARAIGISTQVMDGILNERLPVTPDIAHRLGRAFGMSPDIWLRMQQAVDLYDLQKTNGRVNKKIERIAV